MGSAPVKRLDVTEPLATVGFRDAIVGDHDAPGDTLPSERVLADQFQANRSTNAAAAGQARSRVADSWHDEEAP